MIGLLIKRGQVRYQHSEQRATACISKSNVARHTTITTETIDRSCCCCCCYCCCWCCSCFDHWLLVANKLLVSMTIPIAGFDLVSGRRCMLIFRDNTVNHVSLRSFDANTATCFTPRNLVVVVVVTFAATTRWDPLALVICSRRCCTCCRFGILMYTNK